MNATERPAFTRWHRPSALQLWRPVVQAESHDERWATLLIATAGGDVMVTASHRDPKRMARQATTELELRMSMGLQSEAASDEK
jgi:hypothetical protein